MKKVNYVLERLPIRLRHYKRKHIPEDFCPDHFGLCNIPECEEDDEFGNDDGNCEKCWNQEVNL